MVERGFVKLENFLFVDGLVVVEELVSIDIVCARLRFFILVS